MGKWKSFIVACLRLGVAIGVGFYIYRSINHVSSKESSNTVKSGKEKTHATNEDFCKIQDFCHAANHKPVDLQRDKQIQKSRESEDFNTGREGQETVSSKSEIKLKCSENEDYSNEDTSADNETKSLTESQDVNNSNENDKTVDIVTTGSCSPGRRRGYHRGQYWIPCYISPG